MTNLKRAFRRFPLLAIGFAGCAQQAPESATPEPAPISVSLAPTPVSNPVADPKPGAAQPQPAPAQPTPPPPTFLFPADLAGQALPRVVAPDVAKPLPAERVGATPKPRVVPTKLLEPDALVRTPFAPVPVPGASLRPTKPAAPPEKVPVDFGAGADGVPAKLVLPVAPVVTEIARDVSLPPAPPVLGRPVTDRVSLDDPTGEFGNAEVVAGVVKVALAVSGFVKVAIPDPFELAEHVKPKVPATAEPSVEPVPVNPQRVK